ncbi:MAG TPA: hypothetical protein VL651_05085 [Bacteroidia bacterium]|nr:hypothetical protein [Bacteroidia bacterium]
MKIFFVPVIVMACCGKIVAQPYVDIFNANSQLFHSQFHDTLYLAADTIKGNYFSADNTFSVTLPIKLSEREMILVKPQLEDLHFSLTGPKVNLYADYKVYGMPVGFQFTSASLRWKTLLMFIPRYETQHSGDNTSGWQFGGTVLETFAVSDKLKLKFGLYYNREFFGNFFVPLAGIDWTISPKWRMFGVMPNNMRIENTSKTSFHYGIAYKNFQRSYCSYTNLTDSTGTRQTNGYLRMKECEAKIYADVYLAPKIVLFADAGYMIQYSFTEGTTDLYKFGMLEDVMQKKIDPGFVFTLGLAFRMPTDPALQPSK